MVGCQQQDCVQGGLEVWYLPGAIEPHYHLDLRSVGRRAATSITAKFYEVCLEIHSTYSSIRLSFLNRI